MTGAVLPLPAPGTGLCCERCRELLDADDLFCPNCGHESPVRPGEEERPAERTEVQCFECSGCGAQLTWSLAVQGLRCAFCGRTTLEPRPPLSIPSPRFVVPFGLDRSHAEAIFREWLGSDLFRPTDLTTRSSLTEMRGVYLPFWSFELECHAYWTADSSATPRSADASWAPYFGEHRGRYQHIVVPASNALTPGEIEAIGAGDLAAAAAFAPEILAEHPAETFSITRKAARRIAAAQFEQLVRSDCSALVPEGRQRNLKINPLFTGVVASAALFPVWILAFEYRGEIHRFLVNGQTGKADGTAPLSVWKISAVALLGLLALLVTILLLQR
jgi:predicted RNA-binding Zn-ribbon protein involved in translation (DUF1610 family)